MAFPPLQIYCKIVFAIYVIVRMCECQPVLMDMKYISNTNLYMWTADNIEAPLTGHVQQAQQLSKMFTI